jgi:hypothetical protein
LFEATLTLAAQMGFDIPLPGNPQGWIARLKSNGRCSVAMGDP